MATSSVIDEEFEGMSCERTSENFLSQEIRSESLSYRTPNKYSYSDSFEQLNESSNILPQEIRSNSLSLRTSSRTARNYSYSDSFETSSSSSMKEKSKDLDIQTTALKQKDNFLKSDDHEDDHVSYLSTFEPTEWSDLNPSGESFTEQNNGSVDDDNDDDTQSDSSSGILNKRTIFDASDIRVFHNSLQELDTSPRFQREITPARKQTPSQCSKEEKEKEMFIRKCCHQIEKSKEPEQSKSSTYKYDDSLKQFLDTFMRKFSEKPLSDSTGTTKCRRKNKNEVKREELLRAPFDADPSLLAKIKMKNLIDTMNKAATVRVHDAKECKRCRAAYNKMEGTLACKRFIQCKVNDLTRKRREDKIEDHMINMASLRL